MRRDENWNHLHVVRKVTPPTPYETMVFRYSRHLGKGLTGEQHTALMLLCKYRHELHSTREDFKTIGSTKKEFLQTFFQVQMPILLRNAKLPECTIVTFPIWNDISAKMTTYFIDKVNTEIEDYLRNIDRTYGTQYCPTGIRREARREKEVMNAADLQIDELREM